MVTYLTIRFSTILLLAVMFMVNFASGMLAGKLMWTGKMSFKLGFVVMIAVSLLTVAVMAMLL